LVYLPWYVFVEAHGGYASLVRHHRGYVNPAAWWPYLEAQMGEAYALSGEPYWAGAAGLLAWYLFVFASSQAILSRSWSWRRCVVGSVRLALVAVLCSLEGYVPWWIGLAWTPWLLMEWERSRRLLGFGWLVMALLTPFYHPYARLWLPLHAFGWLTMAGALARLSSVERADVVTDNCSRFERGPYRRIGFAAVALAASTTAAIHWHLSSPYAIPWHCLFDLPRTTLRSVAYETIPAAIPRKGTVIRVFARRPMAYYLAIEGSYRVKLEASLSWPLPQDADAWFLIDSAMLPLPSVPSMPPPAPGPVAPRQWEVDGFLDPVTLLDTEPGLAFQPQSYRQLCGETQITLKAPSKP
jgi:hypothetical protein